MWWSEDERPKTSGDDSEGHHGVTWDELDLKSLESEAFLLGQWKNFAELEKTLNLDELTAIVEAARDRDERRQRFMAAIQGIDLNAGEQTSNEEKFAKAQARAQAYLEGRSQTEIEFGEVDIDYEIEE